jgi:hypothetical protein
MKSRGLSDVFENCSDDKRAVQAVERHLGRQRSLRS